MGYPRGSLASGDDVTVFYGVPSFVLTFNPNPRNIWRKIN